MKKIVPTAEPAKPEKSRKPHVRMPLAEPRQKDRQKHDQNEEMLPKDNHFGIDESLNGIRHALAGLPESNEPRTVI